MHLDKSEEWKLMEHWPKIMEKAHILDVILDSALKRTLYNAIWMHTCTISWKILKRMCAILGKGTGEVVVLPILMVGYGYALQLRHHGPEEDTAI